MTMLFCHDSIKGCVRPSVRLSVRLSVGPLVMLLSAGRDEPANDLFRVYELVFYTFSIELTSRLNIREQFSV